MLACSCGSMCPKTLLVVVGFVFGSGIISYMFHDILSRVYKLKGKN